MCRDIYLFEGYVYVLGVHYSHLLGHLKIADLGPSQARRDHSILESHSILARLALHRPTHIDRH